MRTDSNVNIQKVIKSFSFAVQGITLALRSERNLKIHFAVTVLVVIFGFFLSLSTMEWLFILFAIGGVISLELLNSALERVVDLVTEEFHPLAKQAKDMAAGAVFAYAILSVVVGLIIFMPKILSLLF